jgi:hypothetical protein
MNNPIYVHFYSNEVFLYTKQLDTRISLSDLRSYLSISNNMQFLYDKSPIELYSESDFKIIDVLQFNTQLYLRDSTILEITDCVSEVPEFAENKQIQKQRGRKLKKSNRHYNINDIIDRLLSPQLLSNWYKRTENRIRKVNFEVQRKRFTSLIFNVDKPKKKISLNITSILGILTLREFMNRCLPYIVDFFNQYFEKSDTRYLMLKEGKIVIECRKLI